MIPDQVFAPMPVTAAWDRWVTTKQPLKQEISFGFISWAGVVTTEFAECSASDGTRAWSPISCRTVRRTREESKFPPFKFTIVSASGTPIEYTVARRGMGLTSNGSALDISGPTGSWTWKKRRFKAPRLLRSSGEEIFRAGARFAPKLTILQPVSRTELDLIAVTWIMGLQMECFPGSLLDL